MNTAEILKLASSHIEELSGHVFDVLTINKPISPEAALNLARIVSKLSPMLGNLIEFNTVEVLNDRDEYKGHGTWERQDPGFPDTIFRGTVDPVPGFEIKAWFPLATEITARFKDSQLHFREEQTNVCMLAWLPEHLIFGRPYIVDVLITSGSSIAAARDNHYHNPPDYLVLEPEDTAARTANLQQTNTNGYKFQGTAEQFAEAEALVLQWGNEARAYQPSANYQTMVRQLIARFPYRLDTNFAKMDRIGHNEIEEFKARVLRTKVHGLTIAQWARLTSGKGAGNDSALREALSSRFDIREGDPDDLLQ